MGQDQADRLAAQPLSKPCDVVEAGRQTRAAVVRIEPVQSCLTEQPAIDLDGLCEGMRQVPLHPQPGVAFVVGWQAVRIAPETPHDLGRTSKGQPLGDVGPAEGPQADAVAAQFGYGVGHSGNVPYSWFGRL